MRTLVHLVAAGLVLATAAGASAGRTAQTPVSASSTTAGVATLELIDPLTWSGRSVPTGNGTYFSLCDRGSLRPCAIGAGAVQARRQAFELALSTLRTTSTDLVVVALPQSATRSVLLVFERDLLAGSELDPLRETETRLYLMGGLVCLTETEDSLILVRLRLSPGARSGR
jgi:hypothetical protein